MEEKVLTFIQDQIGYTFKNKYLLRQAFVRRSYSQEYGGENNEVLEFIGDKALDFAVVRLLAKKYGHMTNRVPVDTPKLSVHFIDLNPKKQDDSSPNEFICDCDEGVLSGLKQKLVSKKTLARRIDDLGLAGFLIMGKGDIQENVAEEDSVKEDLFEAILGAVALDCAWDMQEIFETAEIMLVPEQYLADNESENYVELLQEWMLWKNGEIPLYHFEKASYESSWYVPFNGISQHFNLDESRKAYEIQYHCLLKIDNNLPLFRGFGRSKPEARMAVCKIAYEYLEQKGLLFSIQDEIEDPNKADAINQLEILSRRGYFSIPTYDFELNHDENGNPIWKCICRIKEYDICFKWESSSKKEAKKSAAFKMLKYVLDKEK